MRNKDIIISMMIISTAITALFIPPLLFYIFAIITILAACYLIYLHSINKVNGEKQFWQLIISIITFLLGRVMEGKISICFYYSSLSLFIWFVLYNSIVVYDRKKQKNEEKSGVKQSGVLICNEEIKNLIDDKINSSKIDMYKNINNQLVIMKNEYENSNIDIGSLEKELKSHISSIMNNYNKQLNGFLENISTEKSDYKKVIEEVQKNIDNSLISINAKTDELQEIVKQLGELSATDFEILKNKDIRLKFEEAFKIAENEIDIVSPWISRHVMEETGVYDCIKNAVKKGVKVRILYGIGKSEMIYNNSNSRDRATEDIARKLDEDFRKHGDIFKIKRGDTHSKVLICDNKFAIIGSFNFLSFDGKYEKDIRDELVATTTDQKAINKLRNQEFNF